MTACIAADRVIRTVAVPIAHIRRRLSLYQQTLHLTITSDEVGEPGPDERAQAQILSPPLVLKGLLTRGHAGQEPFALHASCHLRAIPQRLMTNATTQTGPVRRHTHVERIIA
jgi:hypothetical protein